MIRRDQDWHVSLVESTCSWLFCGGSWNGSPPVTDFQPGFRVLAHQSNISDFYEPKYQIIYQKDGLLGSHPPCMSHGHECVGLGWSHSIVLYIARISITVWCFAQHHPAPCNLRENRHKCKDRQNSCHQNPVLDDKITSCELTAFCRDLCPFAKLLVIPPARDICCSQIVIFDSEVSTKC